MKTFSLAMLLCTLPLAAQTPSANSPAAGTQPASTPDPWQSLHFLEGTWEAKTSAAAGPSASGRYTFIRELGGHVLARHSTSDPNCKGPASFDCAHGDLLYIFQDSPGQPPKAIYFDNEGHVIHYGVSLTAPETVTFLSEPSPGPQFRLVYERQGTAMTGRFQMRMPGQNDWRSYLEWAGSKD